MCYIHDYLGLYATTLLCSRGALPNLETNFLTM